MQILASRSSDLALQVITLSRLWEAMEMVNSSLMGGTLLDQALEPSTAITPWRDRIQMALALADSPHLRSLLTDCTPPLVLAQPIGQVSIQLGVPTGLSTTMGPGSMADAVLQFERIQCMLLDRQVCSETGSCLLRPSQTNAELARITRYESDLQVLGEHLNLATAIALVSQAGFNSNQIQQIVNLPRDAWHKSWWGQIAPDGSQTPFMRCIRTLRYPDGGYSLQYKDFFEQVKPPCFVATQEQVLLVIPAIATPLIELLHTINQQRHSLQITAAIVLSAQLEDLAAESLMHQGVSLYPLGQLRWARRANCGTCDRTVCPMQGQQGSPVMLCHQYVPQAAEAAP